MTNTLEMQLFNFDAHTEALDEICRLLENDDINRLAVAEALQKLNGIKGLLK